jgi:hypothetical protein
MFVTQRTLGLEVALHKARPQTVGHAMQSPRKPRQSPCFRPGAKVGKRRPKALPKIPLTRGAYHTAYRGFAEEELRSRTRFAAAVRPRHEMNGPDRHKTWPPEAESLRWQSCPFGPGINRSVVAVLAGWFGTVHGRRAFQPDGIGGSCAPHGSVVYANVRGAQRVRG